MRTLTSWLLLICLFVATSASAANHKIVLLETMPVPTVTHQSNEIVQALAAKGYINDKTIDLEILKADGNRERAIELLKKSLAHRRPDLVITVATLATQAAVETLSGTDIPILFCGVGDPVGSGIVKTLNLASGSNISGVLYTQQRDTKLEMASRLLSRSQKKKGMKFGVVCSDYPSTVGDLKELQKITSFSDEIDFIVYQFPYTGLPDGLAEMRKNFSRGIEDLRGRVDFLWEAAGPFGEDDSFTQMLIDSGIPVILGHRPKSVELGALFAVVSDLQGTGRQIVEMTEQIFSGTPVGNLPITVPEKFGLYINLKTASRLGITVPSHLLMIAGKNIIR